MLTETYVVFQRQMRILLRNPVWVIFGLTQPILYLVLFGPLLKGVRGGGLGGDDSWRIFVPGLLMQLALFGAGFAGFGIIQELREGVIDRQRVSPARRLSLILGRTLQVMVTLAVQAVILVLVAIPFGLDPSWGGVATSIVLICVMGIGISAWSYAMGLILKDEDAFAPMIQSVTLPLLLLSGVLLPMSLAPHWLETTSKVNPLTHVVDATRALFRGDFGDGDVLLGAGIAVALGALLAFWGARTFARQSA
jgi:ABC-2 type transport system permease protein